MSDTPLDAALWRLLLRWWADRRPLGWTAARHLENPRVNRFGSGTDEALALAVAEHVKARKGKKR